MMVRFFTQIVAVCCSVTALVVCALPSLVIAQEQRPVLWYVGLYPKNPDYIEVSVDTRYIATNSRLRKVSFGVTFYDDQNKPISSSTFYFTDHHRVEMYRSVYPSPLLLYLEPGRVYVRYFEHHCSLNPFVKGDVLWYEMGPLGWEVANKHSDQSGYFSDPCAGERILEKIGNIQVIGSVPQPKSPTQVAQFDFNGNYDIVHDGWKGTLIINYPSGQYIMADGTEFPVKFNIKEHHIIFYIIGLHEENADGTRGQKFDGYMMTQTKDAIAGITWWHGQPFGFYALKR